MLWSRIQQRLKVEPFRKNYNEHKREWMDATVEFYEGKQRNWDFVINNNEINIKELMEQLVQLLGKKVDRFKDCVPASPTVSPPNSPTTITKPMVQVCT